MKGMEKSFFLGNLAGSSPSVNSSLHALFFKAAVYTPCACREGFQEKGFFMRFMLKALVTRLL